MSTSTFYSASEIVANLARREVSSLELVDEAIARIERFDGQINAVVVRDFDRARATAKQADQRLGRGERAPLLGVPMTVKESYNVVGLPQTWGFKEYANSRATEDAVAVSRLKEAGAIILGKTNVPVALADWQSFNEVYGLTRNPWNLDRSPGGSSGGSAAALAAGYVPLELGSDIGGSVRVPAHFCGVFGHKATYGLIPGRGQALPGVTRSSDLSVCGPLARTAADLDLALSVLARPDGEMASAYQLALPEPRHAELRDYRVLIVDQHPLVPTRQEIRGAVLACADRLEALGVKVAHSSDLVPDLAEAGRVYVQLLGSETSLRQPPERRKELAERAAMLDPNDQSLRALRIRTPNLSHAEWIALDERRMRIRAQWRALFREFDVVLQSAALHRSLSARHVHEPRPQEGRHRRPTSDSD